MTPYVLARYTAVHVAISLLGIVSGLLVAAGLLSSKRAEQATQAFLATTVLTSLTGFGFPFTHVTPAHIVGAISLAVLAVAIYARYGARLEGGWRSAYVVTAMLAFYLNSFVLVVQSFQKVPPLKALAPTQSEPPFAVAQLVVLIVFIVLTIAAVRTFHPERTVDHASL